MFYCLFFTIWHVLRQFVCCAGSSRGLLDHLIEKKGVCCPGTSPEVVCSTAKSLLCSNSEVIFVSHVYYV